MDYNSELFYIFVKDIYITKTEDFEKLSVGESIDCISIENNKNYKNRAEYIVSYEIYSYGNLEGTNFEGILGEEGEYEEIVDSNLLKRLSKMIKIL